MTLRSLPRLPSVEEKHLDMRDKEFICDVATFVALRLPRTRTTMRSRLL